MSDQAKNMLSQQLNGLSDLVERNPISRRWLSIIGLWGLLRRCSRTEKF